MTELEKQTAKEIIEKIENKIEEEASVEFISWRIITDYITQLKREYGLLPKYPTLREYIKKHSSGAYIHFKFKMGNNDIDVVDCYDFETYFKRELLDELVVVKVKEENNGGNCENYQCNHYLTLDMGYKYE